MRYVLLLFISINFLYSQSEKTLEEVTIVADKYSKSTSLENIKIKQIESKNLAQDIPSILNNSVSITTTSDAGNGIGYSSINIRGNSGSNISISINDIPMNNAESGLSYFVNTPDLLSSASSIQIHRGVGGLYNNSSGFGGSVNIDTDKNINKHLDLSTSFGSFNTQKYSIKAGTGMLFNDRFSLNSRVSYIKSDGYIDRSSSDLKSVYFSANAYLDKLKINAIFFSGKETTQQAWAGLHIDHVDKDRRINVIGVIYDLKDLGKVKGYSEDETDNYRQDNAQLNFKYFLNDNIKLKFSAYYTHGEGYYQNFVQSVYLYDVNMSSDIYEESDLTFQKGLNNDLYGAMCDFSYSKNGLKLELGGNVSRYDGIHFDKVKNIEKIPNRENTFFANKGEKFDFSSFLRISKEINKLQLFADAKFRKINYKIYDEEKFIDSYSNKVNKEDDFLFFNPKLGAVYNFDDSKKIYLSFAIANKEPHRNDYLYQDKKPKPETLYDYELGFSYVKKNIEFTANAYYMSYINQLVYNGKISDTGKFLKENSGKSYRLGLELSSRYDISKKVSISGNLTISKNENIDFKIPYEINTTTKYFYPRNLPNVEKLINHGRTEISFSPSIISAFDVRYKPINNLSMTLDAKYVSSQNLLNYNILNSKYKNKIDAYFVSNFNAKYTTEIHSKKVDISLLVNNIFDNKYTSKGYYSLAPYLFPQSGTNFIIGATLHLF